MGQPEGAVAPNLGQSMGILTLQALPAFPAFDMLLPRGFSFASNPANEGPEAADGFWGRDKDPAAKHLRTRVRVSILPLGLQTLPTKRVGLMQCWHRQVLFDPTPLKIMQLSVATHGKASGGATRKKEERFTHPWQPTRLIGWNNVWGEQCHLHSIVRCCFRIRDPMT